MIPYDQIRSLHIEASSYCNAACPVCSRRLNGGTKYNFTSAHLTLAQHTHFFSENLAKQLTHLCYCGNLGDPTMNPQLVQIFEFWLSHNSALEIQVNTNAGTRNKDFWSELGRLFKGTRCHTIFSIDGLEDTNHIYRRGVQWQKVRTSIDAYIEAGGQAIWEFLVFQHNQHQVEEARELSKKWGFHKFYPKKAMGFAGQGRNQAITVLNDLGETDYYIYPPEEVPYANDMLKTQNSRLQLKQNFPKVRDLYSLKPESLAIVPLDSNYESRLNVCEIDCSATKQKQLYISSEGLVYPCCFIGGRMYAPNRSNFINIQIQEMLNSKGKDAFSLHKRSFYEIVSDPWFQNSFSSTWTLPSIRQGKLAICGEYCAKGMTEVKSALSHKIDPATSLTETPSLF